ncbi:MAG TPA: bifunctional glycosyltransferase/class I SAM-dependent methyltransferase [Terriglobales bacterium]|nr:bifunctional glycosyltransferase/class I SAM-dependent methyltransferase [Terriglobales bacterium]
MTAVPNGAEIAAPARSKRILIFVVAYDAERTIEKVVSRIPASLAQYQTEILVIDDCSRDQTFARARAAQKNGSPFPITVLYNPVSQGYGGNQKIGFHYAIENGFDILALIHGDGQYAPECLPGLLQPLLAGQADAVLGSRMMTRFGALKQGMPLYKFAGNKILTWMQNWVLHAALSEFHSGYRVYSVATLAALPFERNTNDYHFDTELLIQLLRAGRRLKELPIPTYYGNEIRNVKGLRYAFNVLRSTLLSRAQDYSILYERKFDVSRPSENNAFYQPKFHFESPHSLALQRVTAGSSVADIGCAGGYVAQALKQKQCRVTGIDQFPADHSTSLDEFIQCDLDRGEFPVDTGRFDYVLLLDIVEHLRSPERLLDTLRQARRTGTDLTVIFSTGNIAFLVTRLGLFLGRFNYGVRGVLDLTHTRLFTFRTARNLFEQSGYRVEEVRGVPAPFPLAVGDNFLGRLLLLVNKLFIKISKSLFAYQIFMVCTPTPSLEWLLEKAHEASREKVRSEMAGAALGSR